MLSVEKYHLAMKTVLRVFGWIIGLGFYLKALVGLGTGTSIFTVLFFIACGCVIFPPTNDWILRSRYVRFLKIAIGLVIGLPVLMTIFVTLVGLKNSSSVKPIVESSADQKKIENVKTLQKLAKEYCSTHDVCLASLSELVLLDSSQQLKEFNQSDYVYIAPIESPESDNDCVISTNLSNQTTFTMNCSSQVDSDKQ